MFAEKCKAPGSKKYILDMFKVDSMVDLFDIYKTDYLLEFMFLFADRNYRRQNVGFGVCYYTEVLAKVLVTKKSIPTLAQKYQDIEIGGLCGLCTSHISLRISTILDFQSTLSVHFDAFQFNQKKYSDMQKQKLIVLVSKKLSKI